MITSKPVLANRIAASSTVVVIPPRVPRVVHSDLRLGPEGGLEVDEAMRTSGSGVFAAGGCAELRDSTASYRTLEEDARLSGRLAGSNCVGARYALDGAPHEDIHAFGLRWTRVGIGPAASRDSGREVDTVSHRWGPATACSIVHEKVTERVVGVEWVQPEGAPQAGCPPLSSWVTLETLAYGGLGSTDISALSETARLGLSEWPRS
jgi:hypothetical protein